MRGLGFGLHLGARGRGALLPIDLTAGSLPVGSSASGGANGTRFNSSGLLVSASAPRFDHTRAGAARGLLIEPEQRNLILQSSNFASGSWSKASATVTSNAGTGLDGAASADLVTATANVNQLFQLPTLADSTSYCYSHVIKRSAGSNFMFLRARDKAGSSHFAYYKYSDGTLGGTTGTVASRGIEDLGDGWYLIWMVFASATGGTAPLVQVGTASADVTASGTTGDAYYVDAGQLIAGTVPGSRIVTGASAVTRTADAVVLPLTDGTYRFTFDDDSTQDASLVGGLIPTNLNRPRVKTIAAAA